MLQAKNRLVVKPVYGYAVEPLHCVDLSRPSMPVLTCQTSNLYCANLPTSISFLKRTPPHNENLRCLN